MFKKEIRGPILALFFISLGGLLLHLRIHSPRKEAFYLIPAVFGLATTFALPFMFNSKKTVAWAYLINVLAVVVGTITMAYYSVNHWQGPVTVVTVILNSTLADILILCAKLPLAHIILRYWRPKSSGESARG